MLKKFNIVEEVIFKNDFSLSNFIILEKEVSFIQDTIKIFRLKLEREKTFNTFLSMQMENILNLLNSLRFNLNYDPAYNQMQFLCKICKILNKISQNEDEEMLLKILNIENLLKSFMISPETQSANTQFTSFPSGEIFKPLEFKKEARVSPSYNSLNPNNNDNKDQNNMKQAINICFNIACEIYPLRHSIGKYDWESRIKKILKFKLKSINNRKFKPISRKFIGRSKIALLKLRNKGRFIKNGLRLKKKYFKIVN